MSHFIFPAPRSIDPVKWDTTHGPGTIQRYAFEVGTGPNSRDIYPGLDRPTVWNNGGGPTTYTVTAPCPRGASIRTVYYKNNRRCVTAPFPIP